MKRILVSALLVSALAVPVLAQPAPAPGGAPAAGAPGRGPGGAGGRGPAMAAVKGIAGPNAPITIAPEQEIPLAQAVDAVQTAVNACLNAERKSAAAVIVVDLNGNIKAAMAADGTGNAFHDFARRKAYTVLKKNMTSEAFGKQPEIAAAGRGAVLEGDPELITFPGGLPIMKGGQMIGVLSVSGPTGGGEDVKCALAGMAKFKL